MLSNLPHSKQHCFVEHLPGRLAEEEMGFHQCAFASLDRCLPVDTPKQQGSYFGRSFPTSMEIIGFDWFVPYTIPYTYTYTYAYISPMYHIQLYRTVYHPVCHIILYIYVSPCSHMRDMRHPRAPYGRSGGTLQRPRLKASRWQPVMQNPWLWAQQGHWFMISPNRYLVQRTGLSENYGPRRSTGLKPQVPSKNGSLWGNMWVYASFRSTQPLDQNSVPPGCLMIHRFQASEFFDRFFLVAKLKQFENRSSRFAEIWRCPKMGGTQIIHNQRILL